MASTLEIVIQAKDETTAVVKNVSSGLEGFASRLTKIGTIASGFLAGQAVAGGLGSIRNQLASFVGASEEAQKVNAQLNAVLKSTAGTAGVSAEEANRLAESLAHETTFSRDAVKASEALLLTFTQVKENVFPGATKAILDTSVALGQDLQTTTIQVGKALNDPIAGMTALRRVGVSFTESQREQIKALVESNRLYDAQKLILAELAKEFGGSAEAAAGTFQGRMERLGNVIHDFKIEVGDVIVGGLMKLSDWFIAHQSDISGFLAKLQPVLDALKTQFGANLAGIIGAFGDIRDGIGHVVDFVGDLIHGRWAQAWEDFKAAAIDAGKGILNGLMAVFGALPNLLISALNQAIAQINSISLPGISLPLAGQVFGGGSLGIPSIPQLPTQLFDIGGALRDLGAAAATSSAPIVGAGAALEETGGKAAKVKTLIEDLNSAMGQLTSKPTRELADLMVRRDELQAAQASALAFYGTGRQGQATAAIYQRELDAVNNRIKAAEAETSRLKDLSLAADKGLLTEAEQEKVGRILIKMTADHSSAVHDLTQTLNTLLEPAIKDKLIPSFTSATGALSNFHPEVTNAKRALQEFTAALASAMHSLDPANVIKTVRDVATGGGMASMGRGAQVTVNIDNAHFGPGMGPSSAEDAAYAIVTALRTRGLAIA